MSVNVMCVDPGMSGGFAVYDMAERKVVATHLTAEYSIEELVELFSLYEPSIFVIEEVHAMQPPISRQSNFKLGMSFGMWLGLAHARAAKVITVQPKDWQVRIAPGRRSKELKEIIWGAVKKEFPANVDDKYVGSHSHMYDALGILMWFLQSYKGKTDGKIEREGH
jgi:hypothetical protein